MNPPTTYELRLDPNNMRTLVQILEAHEARCKALANLKHITDTEKTVLIGEAAVCQYAYLQLQGVNWQPASGAPDWSGWTGVEAAKAHAAYEDAKAVQTDVQPTPAPQAAALPYRVKGGRTELL